jgi:hypothetical protein
MNSISSSIGRGSSVTSVMGVRRANERVAVPGNGEHHAAVSRVQHHDRVAAQEEGSEHGWIPDSAR